jgi:hypothetical protein
VSGCWGAWVGGLRGFLSRMLSRRLLGVRTAAPYWLIIDYGCFYCWQGCVLGFMSFLSRMLSITMLSLR